MSESEIVNESKGEGVSEGGVRVKRDKCES